MNFSYNKDKPNRAIMKSGKSVLLLYCFEFNKKALQSFETPGTIYLSTRRSIQKDSSFHQNRPQNIDLTNISRLTF
jgi:hypothetical protein